MLEYNPLILRLYSSIRRMNLACPKQDKWQNIFLNIRAMTLAPKTLKLVSAVDNVDRKSHTSGAVDFLICIPVAILHMCLANKHLPSPQMKIRDYVEWGR
jgi:hypothetical protein